MLACVVLSLGICLLCALRASFARGTRVLEINPRYRELLEQLQLRRVDDFMRLPAVIVCGHRNRHTAHLTLGTGPTAFRAFLKREQNTYWRDYVSSVWAGLGWGSRSCREGRMLQALHAARLPGPEFIATGEDDCGRAFLLVRELDGTRELRQVLRQHEPAGMERRSLARRIGRVLAELHDAGFRHADLYSKHVHVHAQNQSIHFLDWQRAQWRRRMGWRCRLQDLAALDATLNDDLASRRERVECLRSYVKACRSIPQSNLGHLLASVRRLTDRLLRKRHIREARQAPLEVGVQNLIWLDGEALCVTREFLDAVGGQVPSWLRQQERPRSVQDQTTVQSVSISLPRSARQTCNAILSRSVLSRPWHWLWCRLRGHPVVAPEMRQAACLFRLQRYGLATPRLLAVGQHFHRPWRSESFLLLETARCRTGLAQRLLHLSSNPDGRMASGPYRRLLWESGTVLRRLHESSCYLPAQSVSDLDAPFAVASAPDGASRVVVRDVASLQMFRKQRRWRAWNDLTALYLRYSTGLVSRTDALRFLLGYLGFKRLNATTRTQLRAWLGRRP